MSQDGDCHLGVEWSPSCHHYGPGDNGHCGLLAWAQMSRILLQISDILQWSWTAHCRQRQSVNVIQHDEDLSLWWWVYYVLVAQATAVIAVHAARITAELTAAGCQQPWTTAHTLQPAEMCSNPVWSRMCPTFRMFVFSVSIFEEDISIQRSESDSPDRGPWRQQWHLIGHPALLSLSTRCCLINQGLSHKNKRI